LLGKDFGLGGHLTNTVRLCHYAKYMAEIVLPPNRSPVKGETLLTWESLERPALTLSKKSLSTLLAIVIALAVIFLFIKEFWLIICMFSLTFLYYAYSVVAPKKVTHTLTSLGVNLAGQSFYKWQEISQIWFEFKYGEWFLAMRLRNKFPSLVFLLLGDMSREKVEEIFKQKEIPVSETPSPDMADQAASRVGKYFKFS